MSPMFQLKEEEHMGVSQNQGYLFGGPHNKDSNILGFILGSPHFGKLPHSIFQNIRNGPVQKKPGHFSS